MARRSSTELAFTALVIEGGLLAPDFLNRIAHLEAAAQSEADYDIPRGLKLRDEIGRYWKIAQNLWQDFAARRERSDRDPWVSSRDFLEPFCRQVLGFADLKRVGQVAIGERSFPIGCAAGEGRVPLVFAGHDQALDKPGTRHGDGTRRRSPFLLAQEVLNASHAALWAVVSNGLKMRVLRDNASLTRPAYIEADLEAIFSEGLYPDFAALWLLAHATRFGQASAEPADCPLEHWRNTAQEDGIRVRDRLREGVANALRVLGTGFLAHSANRELRRRIESGELSTQAWFEQILRLVYRLIFLATIEDRELVFAPAATVEARARYQAGYSLARLRRLAARRRSYDRHADLWQALSITFAGLAGGQPALGLPALGGLFHAAQCPDLDAAQLENQALLAALFGLCFFRDGAALSRVNYRDMDSEELGSVYESLLELVPELTLTASVRRFGFIGDEQEAVGGSSRGNARKLSGSYYTPDSLVQELIRSALDPVIAQTLAAHPRQPVQALLELSVCDPACGSGHFLLAAARRIAEEVARLSAIDGNPLPADYRHALRDVVAHCIHGVDKNPLAVELARTALWLEAYTPDRPLTFLDHHLRCGDALLGILDPAILKAGIPDKAFNALSGDDKTVVTALKKANRDALKAIEKAKTRAAFNLALGFDAAPDAAALDALPDDTLAALEAKRAAFVEAEARSAASRARLAADLFVAAFVLPKTRETQATVPTTQDLWLTLNGSEPRPGVAAAAAHAAHTAQAFHWWQAFPQVRAKGGFDVLLGNPPWERIKLQEQEFFGPRSPEIANAANATARTGLIEALNAPNASSADKRLYGEFIMAKHRAESTSLFAHDSARFPLTGLGDVNLYAMFAETIVQLLHPLGISGFIVPSGLATDNTTRHFFASMIRQQSVVSFFEFENMGFFKGAGQGHMLRFALTTMSGMGRSIPKASYLFQGRSVHHLSDLERRFSLTPEDFDLINPNTKTCPIFQCNRDAELTKAIYRRVPVLIDESKGEAGNPWGIRFMTMFHMANDSGLFRTSAQLTSDGAQRDGSKWVGHDMQVWVPLYEAKMLYLYNHRHGDFSVVPSGDRPHVLPEARLANLLQPTFSTDPFYWVPEAEVQSRLEGRWSFEWLIGWRDVTDARASIRTTVFSVFPRAGVGHTFPLIFPTIGTAHTIATLLANFSSVILDFLARQKVAGLHLTYGYLMQFPVLPPDRYTAADLAFIVPRVLELTYTAHDLQSWAADLGFAGPPFLWDPERRARLRAELDAYYARLYGLTRDELRYILDPADVMGADYPSETFRVLKNNETRQLGEYRTRRLVLEAWDALHNAR